MTRLLVAIALLPVVAGCGGPELVAIRTDGQRIAASPMLKQNYEADRTVCLGETQKANLTRTPNYYGGFAAIAKQAEQDQAASDVFAGCMAQKGYAMVEKEKVDAKLAEYSATAQAIAQEKQMMTGSVR
jgi:hypothetical protein